MTAQHPPILRFSGLPLVRCLHIAFQLACVPLALDRMQHLYQILIPFPTGVFFLISIAMNVLIFSLHIMDTSPCIKIFPAESGGGGKSASEVKSTALPPAFTMQVGRLRRYSTRVTFDARGIQEFGTIHNNSAWILLYILGIGWSLYLLSLGVILARVEAWNQGELFLIYSILSLVGYGLMFFFPERKITLWDQTSQTGVYLMVPLLLLSLPVTPRIYIGKSFLDKFQALVQYNPPVPPKRFDHPLRGPYIPYLLLWTLLVLGASTFCGNLYNYQFVEPVAVVWWLYEIRNVLYNNEQTENLQYPRSLPTKPAWYYLGLLFVWHEVGFKAWYIATFVLFSPLSLGWIPCALWGLYLLTCAFLVWEVWRLQLWRKWRRTQKILVLIALGVELFLQFSAILSTLQIIPLYFSILEFGPIV